MSILAAGLIGLFIGSRLGGGRDVELEIQERHKRPTNKKAKKCKHLWKDKRIVDFANPDLFDPQYMIESEEKCSKCKAVRITNTTIAGIPPIAMPSYTIINKKEALAR